MTSRLIDQPRPESGRWGYRMRAMCLSDEFRKRCDYKHVGDGTQCNKPRNIWLGWHWLRSLYDTIRGAILMCARKPSHQGCAVALGPCWWRQHRLPMKTDKIRPSTESTTLNRLPKNCNRWLHLRTATPTAVPNWRKCILVVFTVRCYASAVLAMGLCLSVSVSVSVCVSQVGVLLKRLNVGSHKQHRTIAQGL